MLAAQRAVAGARGMAWHVPGVRGNQSVVGAAAVQFLSAGRSAAHRLAAPADALVAAILANAGTPAGCCGRRCAIGQYCLHRLLFWLVAPSMTLASIIASMMSVHLLTVLEQRGVPLATAVAFGAIVGRARWRAIDRPAGRTTRSSDVGGRAVGCLRGSRINLAADQSRRGAGGSGAVRGGIGCARLCAARCHSRCSGRRATRV